MNLYFVRHGETEKNRSKCYYGSIDIDLNDEGIIQAERAEKLLKKINFSKIFVSEKKRAIKTAEIILRNKINEFNIDKRLNERDFGKFEDKDFKELEKLYPEEWKEWCEDWKNTRPPEGESCIEVFERVKSFMEELLKLNEENVIVVTHGGVIRSVYCYLLGGNLDYFWSFGSCNGDISVLKYEFGNLYIDSIIHV